MNNNNNCLSAAINTISNICSIVDRENDQDLRKKLLEMFDPEIREFMKDEILGDNQLSFDMFRMYWENTYPFLKLNCFTRYLIPFNKRVDGKRYRLEKTILNEAYDGQFVPDVYIVLTTDEKGIGAGHYRIVQESDIEVLTVTLENYD